jgi:hypothetical protein
VPLQYWRARGGRGPVLELATFRSVSLYFLTVGLRSRSPFGFLGSYERRLCGRRHERRRRAGIVRTFYSPVNVGDERQAGQLKRECRFSIGELGVVEDQS